MLNTDEVAELRRSLESEQARLVRNAQDGLQFSMNRERSSIGRDSIDESMEEEIFSTELRLRDREKFLLGKITGALDRLSAGTINECESCAEPIGIRRLLARPVTTLCIECKEEAEKEESSQVQARQGGMGLRDDLGSDELGVPPAEES